MKAIQEEVNQKTIAFAIKASKVTTSVLKKAIVAYLRHRRNKVQKKQAERPHGKVKIKDLIKLNGYRQDGRTPKAAFGEAKSTEYGIENIEITDKNIKSFEKVARKYNIDYSLKRDKSQNPPKYYVFFKAHDTNAITMAFKEYTQKTLNKSRRPSLIKRIQRNTQKVKQQTKQKEQQKQLPEAQKLLPAPKKADREL